MSGLFSDNVTYSQTDDFFNGEYNNVEFKIDETELEHTIKRENGKLETTDLFKGVAMHFKMQKKINAKVLIYSKSLINKIPKGYEKVVLEYENFNAAAATVHIQGRNIHPGYAKGKMLNSILIGMELNGLLPVEQRPEHTDGYEGFFHITGFNGTVEESVFSYIIRDHDINLFEKKKETLKRCVEFINSKYGNQVASVEIKHQYYNMRKEVEPHYHIIEKAVKAMEMEGVTPRIQPIRGGTDGANLSFMGLPCPNIFAGGHNFHGKMEYIPLESMEKAFKVIINIISLFAQN